MSEPSDPQRPSNGELPQETAAFDDTEFSFGGSGLSPSSSHHDDTANADSFAISASENADTLGHATNPEATGIIPVVDDTTISAATDTTDDDDAEYFNDEDANRDTSRRSGLASLPPWTWILAIGILLAVLIGLFTANLMRSNDVSDSTPLTSLTPSYSRPTAWNPDHAVTATAPIPAGGYDSSYGYEGDNTSSEATRPTSEPGPTTPSGGHPVVTNPSPGGMTDTEDTDGDIPSTDDDATDVTGNGARGAAN